MKLKYRKKNKKKTGKNFRGGGGRIFLAGQNIPLRNGEQKEAREEKH